MINELKRWIFEKISDVDKTLAKLTKIRKEKTYIIKNSSEKSKLTTNTIETQKTVTTYIQYLYANIQENTEEMDKFQNMWFNEIEPGRHKSLKHTSNKQENDPAINLENLYPILPNLKNDPMLILLKLLYGIAR